MLRPPVAVAFSGRAPSIQLQRSMMWMFCSTRMSPERARSQSQLRRRYSSGPAPGWTSFPDAGAHSSCRKPSAILPSAPALIFSAIAAIGGALRHWKPTSTLCVGLTRLAISRACCAWADVDSHRLLAVDMFARCDRGLEMLHVEEGRRGNLNQIDIRRSGELLKGMRAVEEQLAVDGGVAQAGVELVEVAAGRARAYRERDRRAPPPARTCSSRTKWPPSSAAVAAAQQAVAHGGVGLVAEGGAGLEQQQAGSNAVPV